MRPQRPDATSASDLGKTPTGGSTMAVPVPVPGPGPTMLVNLPTGPDSVTPSDNGPGTPNSAMTSMSELSTVAIKDGHRGHLPHFGPRDPNNPVPFDSERADRISRMAGLDRVAQQPSGVRIVGGGAAVTGFGTGFSNSGAGVGAGFGGSGLGIGNATANLSTGPTGGYFLPSGEPRLLKAQSTVGSASATSAAKGSTATWTSTDENERDERDCDVGHDDLAVPGTDKISLPSDTSSLMGDTTTSSVWNGLSGMSDGGSLVGFDEDAGSRQLGSTSALVASQSMPSPGPGQLGSAPGGPSNRGTLPYAFPSYLRARSPSSVSSQVTGSVAESVGSRNGGVGGGGGDPGRILSGTPPPVPDRDDGMPNGRHLSTVERAEVELRQRAQRR